MEYIIFIILISDHLRNYRFNYAERKSEREKKKRKKRHKLKIDFFYSHWNVCWLHDHLQYIHKYGKIYMRLHTKISDGENKFK